MSTEYDRYRVVQYTACLTLSLLVLSSRPEKLALKPALIFLRTIALLYDQVKIFPSLLRMSKLL